MTRFAFFSLLLAALGTSALAPPLDQQEALQAQSRVCSPNNKWCWEDCGSDAVPLHITYISVSPDPPLPGQELTVTARGTASSLVEEGAYAAVAVKVGRIKILQKEFNLCEEARNANTSVQCPVEKGTYEVVHTVTLPKEIPPAPFNVNVKGYTVDDDDLMCLDLSIDFRKGRLLSW